MSDREATFGPAWLESWKTGQSDDLQLVFSHYRVVNDIVFADQDEWVKTGNVRQYYPLSRPSLLFELAKIPDGDVDAAVQFVHEWGVLNRLYDRVGNAVSRFDLEWAADPLWLIWGHAYSLRMLLRLWKSVTGGQPEQIIDTIKAGESRGWFATVRESEDDESLPTWFKHMHQGHKILSNRPDYIEGDELEIPSANSTDRSSQDFSPWEYEAHERAKSMTFIYRWRLREGTTVDTAEKLGLNLILDCISSNFGSMRPYVTINEPYGLWSRRSPIVYGYEFQSLYQVAYWQLSQLITQGQLVGRCKECKELFSKVRQNQEFCSPSEVEVSEAKRLGTRSQSRCGLRYRTRESRKRKEAQS